MAQTYRVPGRKNRGSISSFRILSPNKGINNIIPDTDIDELESPDSLNIDYVESGNPSTRKGRVQFSAIDADGAGAKIFEYYKSTGVKYLLKISGTSLKSINPITGALTTIAGKVFTTGKVYSCFTANDCSYILNGTDSMGKFDGTTLTTPSTGIPAGFAIWHKGFTFAAGNPSFPNRLYWSAPGVGTVTPDDFTSVGSGWVNIDANDGDKITGIGLWGDTVIVFKERAIYSADPSSLDGTATTLPTIKPIIKGIGCVAHNTIANVDNDMFYLSRKGVYVIGNEPTFFSAIRTNELSARIRKTMDTINPANFNKAHAKYFDFKYILSVPIGGATYNDSSIVYDKKYQSWSLWNNQTFSSICSYIDSNNYEILLACDSNNGKVYQLGVGSTDDGMAIESWWYSKRHNLKTFDEFKRWFDATFLFRSVTGVLSLQVILDGYVVSRDVYIGSVVSATAGIGVKEWGLVNVGTDGVTSEVGAPETIADIVKRLKINRPARSIQIKISTNGINNRFTLTGYNVTYYPYGHFKFPSSDKL